MYSLNLICWAYWANDLCLNLSNVQEGRNENKGGKELFVRNLSFNTDYDSLKKFFESYGNVTRVNILKNDEGKSKGIGFVTYENASEAQKAINDASNMSLDGR